MIDEPGFILGSSAWFKIDGAIKLTSNTSRNDWGVTVWISSFLNDAAL